MIDINEKAYNFNLSQVKKGLAINKLFELLEVDNFEDAWIAVYKLQYENSEMENEIECLESKINRLKGN